ncbi:NAD(+) synthase [Aureibacter tunicatorum]|uniref:Glutamine-dependent NAD(+) synthetase n=1 Tax=Aureibacter tunicatorum TaxID=866807 RepID=A0AAE3XSS4_9BACT|nr:NAD(+) synthase [Aureibacter tunicatorum]MDR6241216.1 NAD+ synthase (glutamine-hydrolyzing) [Aureibacter tunicatorum]BDD03477.1 NAD(+) synthase [Aureibacter tunicatorum]
MSTIKIGGATLNQMPLDWAGNISNIKSAIQDAISKGINILCLPELSITGYGCEDLFLSHWLPEKALSFLPEIAEECINITVAVGLPLKYGGHLYNCACVIKDQQILGFTAKEHLANEGVHYEPRWFSSWQSENDAHININDNQYVLGQPIYNIDGINLGIEICEDAWQNRRPAIDYAEQNVDVILNLSASHFAFGKKKDRENIAIPASEDFKCVYVYTNLLGNEAGRMIYDGEILIAQYGKLIAQNQRFSFENYQIVSTNVAIPRLQTVSHQDIIDEDINKSPLQNDFTSKEEEFAYASALALFDYLRKSWSKGFALSLSGGADSSACAVMVSQMIKRGVEILGIETFLSKIHREDLIKKATVSDNPVKFISSNIFTTVYQGTKNSGDATFDSAKNLAESIGATFYHWNIDDEVNSYTEKVEKALGRKLKWESDDLALQNIQARSRSPIIWMIANIEKYLLLTTSNRSEGDVGYATMDGDTSGSIAPIAAVDKHFVLQWLKWAESSLGFHGLKDVNSLTPTAELRPPEQTQTDEQDLMPYNIIVEIEKLAIKEYKSPLEVLNILKKKNLEPENLLKAHIAKFYQMWSRNQWKRERIAPAFHLDDFNVDPRTWCRFPILSGGYKLEIEEMMNE